MAVRGKSTVLAYKREGVYLDTGILSNENKLDGEDPFRMVVPQKYVEAPDQSSKSDQQTVVWPYNYDWDHNAGSCSRSATIIKIEPLPAGTTDIDILEAGWSYVDQKKIIVYGAIDGTDSNGNGILDSEEGTDPASDFDSDLVPDHQDSDTAALRHAYGVERIRIHTSKDNFSNVVGLKVDDPAVPQSAKPAGSFPYGLVRFQVTGLAAGDAVTLSLEFPNAVPTRAAYYKVNSAGHWNEIPIGSNDGDNLITLTLTDGNPLTDADGVANGTIEDPGALAIGEAVDDGSSSGEGSCFIGALIDK